MLRLTLLASLAVLLSISTASDALTLADVVSEGGFSTANESVYSDFKVKFRGGKRVNRNLADYEVTLTDRGFTVRGAAGADRGDGRMILKYAVSVRGVIDDVFIQNGGVAIDMEPGNMLKAKRTFRKGKKKGKLGKLFVMPGNQTDGLDLGGRDSVRVRDVIYIWRGFPDTSTALLTVGTNVVPEPGTALLLGSGLLGLASLRRRSA